MIFCNWPEEAITALSKLRLSKMPKGRSILTDVFFKLCSFALSLQKMADVLTNFTQ